MEPSRKHPEIEPNVRPNLRVIEGGGESTPERTNLSSVENSASAQDLSQQERRFGVIQGGGESTPERGKLSSVSDNINNARESEQAGGFVNNFTGAKGEKQATTLKGLMKKRGPIGVIAALILGGGGALGFFGITLMPVTLTEHFTNDLNDMNASQERKTINFVGNKLGGNVQKKMSLCNGLVSIRCKFNTLSPEMAKRFEDKGFKFGEKMENGKRVAFSSIEFPDGTIVHSVSELNALLRNSAVAVAAFNTVYNLKNSIFIVGNFFKNALGKLKLTKAKKVEGNSKEEAKQSFEESAKGEKGTLSTSVDPDKPNDNATDEQKKSSQAKNDTANEVSRSVNEKITLGQKIKALPLKVSNALALPQLGCLAYNITSFISATAKLKKALRFAAFAMIFLTFVSALKAGYSTEAETGQIMSVLAPSEYPTKIQDADGNMVDNPYIGMNALDSEAYKVVAYGDTIQLGSIAARFFITAGVLGAMEKILKWLNDTFSKEFLKTTCRVVNSTAAAVVGFLAAPAFTALIYGLTSVLPIEELAAALVNTAVEAVAGGDYTTDITGALAGDFIFVGAATVLGGAASHFGLKPGAFKAIKKNMADNNEVIERDIAASKYEASKTPFDISNRYSFLGSLAFNVANLTPSFQQPLLASTGKILSAFPTSIGMITKNANAAYSMPVANYTESRFQFADTASQSIGIAGDIGGVNRYVPFDPLDSEVVLSHMESSGQIDSSGNPTPGSYYEKYDKYCDITKRDSSFGTTTVPLEEQKDDPAWYTGEKCVDPNSEDDNQMASEYKGYHSLQKVWDNEDDTDAAAPAANTPVTGDAKSLALRVANNPDIQFVNPATKAALEDFSNTGQATNSCKSTFLLDPAMLGTVLTLANKYKILVNNIGFISDRSVCFPNDQHTKGAAIDINGIEIKGGAKTNWGNITYTQADLPVVTSYANDWLATLAPDRGGVGQLGCLNGLQNQPGGFKVTPPPGATGINGNLQFPDDCSHLHIDARTR